MSLRRKVGVGLIIAGFIVAGILVARFLQTPSPLTSESGQPLVTRFSSPHFVGYRKGERQWSLKAAAVEEGDENESGIVHLIDISEGILYREGKPDLHFTADRGEWNQERGSLALNGAVRFSSGGETVFEAERVVWDGDAQELTAPVRVHLNYKGQDIAADRLVAKGQEDTVTLSGNVVWATESGLEVRAQKAVYTKGDIHFSGLEGPVRLTLEGESKE